VKISTSYKFISTVLSVSIILSFTVSICSMDSMEEMCDQMMMEHSSMSEMAHSGNHNDMMHEKSTSNTTDCLMNIDCECTTEDDLIATIAPNVLLKTNISPILVSLSEISTIDKNISTKDLNLSIQKYYSPPPLFLANESFLI